MRDCATTTSVRSTIPPSFVRYYFASGNLVLKLFSVLKHIIFLWIKWIMGRCYLHLWWYFYNGRLLTDRSSLLKTPKTRETKTWITQNVELVWPIQVRTMWKLTSWGFWKCGTFWGLKVLNQSYWLSQIWILSDLRVYCANLFSKNYALSACLI